MKYLMSWTYRMDGSVRDNEASVQRALDLFAKWSPSQTATIHQFVQRLDSAGGFAVVESENPADLAEATAKFSTIADYILYPVIDIDESVAILQQGIDFRESVQ